MVHEMPSIIRERSLEGEAKRIAELADAVVFAAPSARADYAVRYPRIFLSCCEEMDFTTL